MKEIIEELFLEGAKPADTPMIVSQSSKKDSDSRALSMRDATLYWGHVANLNYLAMDRPDIRYAASTMGSHASSPKHADKVKLERVERFWGDRPLGRTAAGRCCQTTTRQTPKAIGQQIEKTSVQRTEECRSTLADS